MANFIYCYTTPEIDSHNGWCKIGMTKNASDGRIKQQAHTVDVATVFEWEVETSYGDNLFVSDNEFRKYLVEEYGCETQKDKKTEWVKIDPEDAKFYLEKLMCAFRNTKVVDEEANIKVFRTNDFSKFKVLEGNRDVTQKRVDIIKESINSVGYVNNPIIVNENMEVIDGQGRLEACRQLNIPVLYIIHEGANSEHCRAMNERNTAWTSADHISHWCKLGNENFIRMHEVAVEYGYNESFIFTVANNIRGDGCRFQNRVREGNLIFTETDADVCREVCSYVRSLEKYIKHIGGSCSNARECIAWIVRNTDIDKDKLTKAFEKNWGSFLPFVAKNDKNIEMISEFYNKGVSALKQNRFERDYADFVRIKKSKRTRDAASNN